MKPEQKKKEKKKKKRKKKLEAGRSSCKNKESHLTPTATSLLKVIVSTATRAPIMRVKKPEVEFKMVLLETLV